MLCDPSTVPASCGKWGKEGYGYGISNLDVVMFVRESREGYLKAFEFQDRYGEENGGKGDGWSMVS